MIGVEVGAVDFGGSVASLSILENVHGYHQYWLRFGKQI